MTHPTPADELRAAAATIRRLATADGVPPGPWTMTPRYRKGTQIIAQYDLHKPPLPGSTTPGVKSVSPTRPDALYAAAMHPGVGLALATWLEHTADTLSCTTRATTDLDLECALATARQLNTAFQP